MTTMMTMTTDNSRLHRLFSILPINQKSIVLLKIELETYFFLIAIIWAWEFCLDTSKSDLTSLSCLYKALNLTKLDVQLIQFGGFWKTDTEMNDNKKTIDEHSWQNALITWL